MNREVATGFDTRRRPEDPTGFRALRFCLVSSAHVCNNPRLVKEADALVAAGHEVRVVTARTRPVHALLDMELVANKAWRLTLVPADRSSVRGRLRWFTSAVIQRSARALLRFRAPASGLREIAASRYCGALVRAVCSEPADVVIGHNLAALPVAARSATKLGAQLGFDIEDLHVEVLPDTADNAFERALIASVEQEYLPRCDCLTASSPGIADEITRRYGVNRPTVILNTFPEEAHRARAASARVGTDRRPSLYWYSQTIGPDRGLEDALEAMALAGVPMQLHLRGEIRTEYRGRLVARASRLGLSDALHVHPPAPPAEMTALASEHDIGLALEQPSTINRDICITNKLFTYLAAGLAIAASSTAGQRVVLDQAPGIGFLYEPGDAAGLARGLRAMVESPSTLALAKQRSLEAARTQFSWELDARRLVDYLTAATSHRPRRVTLSKQESA